MTPTRGREDWGETIDRIQDSLAQSLQENPEPSSDPIDFTPPSPDVLERRFAELQSSLDRAERSAAETDALLRDEIEMTQQWIATLQRLRDTLANWTAEGGTTAWKNTSA